MVTELDFVTLDVFTTTPFRGNPLAIVHLPPPSTGTTLSQEQKQAIAREFNLSETVFIHDAASDEALDSQTRRFDIFMTDKELPFAGHPTIGTASYLQSQGVTKLIAKAGPIPIQSRSDGIVSAGIPHNTYLNSKTLGDVESFLKATSLHSTPEIRSAELKAPLFCIVKGMTFLLVQLPSLDQLAQVSPGAFPIAARDVMDGEWSNTFIGRYYFVVSETSVAETGIRTVKLRTRMVEEVIEDPATGSAACALTSYLALHQYSESQIRFEVTQGVEMGRQSDIVVEIKVAAVEGSARAIQEVLLGGTARQIMKGTIAVPPAL